MDTPKLQRGIKTHTRPTTKTMSVMNDLVTNMQKRFRFVHNVQRKTSCGKFFEMGASRNTPEISILINNQSTQLFEEPTPIIKITPVEPGISSPLKQMKEFQRFSSIAEEPKIDSEASSKNASIECLASDNKSEKSDMSDFESKSEIVPSMSITSADNPDEDLARKIHRIKLGSLKNLEYLVGSNLLVQKSPDQNSALVNFPISEERDDNEPSNDVEKGFPTSISNENLSEEIEPLIVRSSSFSHFASETKIQEKPNENQKFSNTLSIQTVIVSSHSASNLNESSNKEKCFHSSAQTKTLEISKPSVTILPVFSQTNNRITLRVHSYSPNTSSSNSSRFEELSTTRSTSYPIGTSNRGSYSRFSKDNTPYLFRRC